MAAGLRSPSSGASTARCRSAGGVSIVAEDGETEAGHYAIDRPITLEAYNRGTWQNLSTEGRRALDNPIAARLQWPRRFEGTWQAFSTFPHAVDPLPLIRARRAAVQSYWNSAVLSRWLIRYNFRPKVEWPEGATTIAAYARSTIARLVQTPTLK